MALNKYMHPRNIYKTPPDFKQLAEKYPEFSSIIKVDVTGKVTIDFKDPHSLRILTKYLLKHDFNVDVEIPEDRLVPTLPLRLNYILWIEDLLDMIDKKINVKGIDIGTGACAVYPLLGAVMNKWHMLGTETDNESFLKADINIKRNNLQELITVKKNSTPNVIEYLFKDNEEIYHFCMCNPPFYCNIQEVYEARGISRPPPKNGFTGSPQELITEGGELEFIRKIIAESKNCKDNVLVFTTMIGHKYNLKELLQDLKADNIRYTHAEFCQGRVTRWGLAWTYQDYDLCKLVPARDKGRKKNLPIAYILPNSSSNTSCNIEEVTKKILSIFESLQITCKVINKKGTTMIIDIVANNNTWSNQRRKRRNLKRQEKEVKRLKLESLSPEETNGDHNVTGTNKQYHTEHDLVSINDNTNAMHNDNRLESPIILSNGQPMVHAIVTISKKKKDFILEMEHIGGTLGKEGLHQILQYIKNIWSYIFVSLRHFSFAMFLLSVFDCNF